MIEPIKIVQFHWSDASYVLKDQEVDRAYDSNIIQLPYGTLLQLHGWRESMPPQPIMEEAKVITQLPEGAKPGKAQINIEA